MTEFKVEKKIPVPPKGHHKYPFNTMKVGDSFAVGIESISKVRPAAWYYGNVHNKIFSVRKESETTYRVWRIK